MDMCMYDREMEEGIKNLVSWMVSLEDVLH